MVGVDKVVDPAESELVKERLLMSIGAEGADAALDPVKTELNVSEPPVPPPVPLTTCKQHSVSVEVVSVVKPVGAEVCTKVAFVPATNSSTPVKPVPSPVIVVAATTPFAFKAMLSPI